MGANGQLASELFRQLFELSGHPDFSRAREHGQNGQQKQGKGAAYCAGYTIGKVERTNGAISYSN